MAVGLIRLQRYLHKIWSTPREERTLRRRLGYRVGTMLLKLRCRALGAYVGPVTAIGHGLKGHHHLIGVFIADNARIGDNVTMYHHVTIGASTPGKGRPRVAPIIGNDVFIGANATIIGRCVIGDGAKIGAGVTLVDAEIPEGAVVINKSAYDLTNGRFVHPQ